MTLHLIKLCVGCDSIDDLVEWIDWRLRELRKARKKPEHGHVTRMVPKRIGELLDGGSLYWVIKGNVQVRQKLLDIKPFVDVYNANDKRIGPVVEAMLRSEVFYSAKAYRAIVKSPTEYAIGAVKALGLQDSIARLLPAGHAATARHSPQRDRRSSLRQMPKMPMRQSA